MGFSPLSAVEFFPLLGKHIYLPLYCPGQCVKLLPGVHFVLHQQFGLLHITVKLDDLRHVIPPFFRRGGGLLQFSKQIQVMVVQGSKACQFLGLAPGFVIFLWQRWGPLVERCPLMVTDASADRFLRVVVPQGFQSHKPLPARRPHRYVFPCLDLIPLFFQIGDEMFKQKRPGDTGIHVRSYLAVPCRLALLLRLPSVPAHGAALFRVFYHGQAMLPAKPVGGLAHEGVGGLAVIVLLSINKGDGVQHKMVVDVLTIQVGGYTT